MPLFSAAPKPAKAIGPPPHVSMAQDYIRSIDERSYGSAGGCILTLPKSLHGIPVVGLSRSDDSSCGHHDFDKGVRRVHDECFECLGSGAY